MKQSSKRSIYRPVPVFLLVVSLVFISCAVFAQSNRLEGKWRGEFTIRDNIKVPFNFEINDSGLVTLINGQERFESGKLSLKKDSVFIPLDQFDNELAMRLSGKKMTGVLRKQDKTSTIASVLAEKGRSDRFVKPVAATKDISGRYALEFVFDSGKKESSVAVFEQKGNTLTGTFLKPSGDARFLEGVVSGNRFFLSSFIGSSPGYYEGTVTDDGRISGFQAGTKIKHRFAGQLDSSARLNDAFEKLSDNGSSKISLQLPDMDGKLISLTDEKFKNKVVIIAITGTWCPNCVDEAAFLSPWYKENRQRGVEIITVHFERQSDTAYTKKVMSRFRKRFDIDYDQVFGGPPVKDTVLKALPGLTSFHSFPTTIFVDRQGKISKIHSGYTGPATGKFYDEFVKEFNGEIDRLLTY